MAIPPAYPPYQQPLLDRQTGRVSKPWHLFFLALTNNLDGDHLADGSVTLDKLQPIPSPRLLGRGSSGNGPVEIISLGTGLAMTGTVLSVSAGGGDGLDSLGYWTVLTDGNVDEPDLIFADGEAIAVFVPTP